MNLNFEYITNLQYQVRHLGAQVEAFKSGEKYKAMKAGFRAQLLGKDREIRRLKAELASARLEAPAMRRNWTQVFEDLEKEHGKELQRRDRELKLMEERALRAEEQRDGLKDKNLELRRENYQLETELEEERGRNQMLKAQIARDYTNSSVPSSLKPNHKKIHNSREKTDRKPGGQPGHAGHGRKTLAPTRIIDIPAPEKYADSPDYSPTGKTITRQMINISMTVRVDEYRTAEFRSAKTGQRVHAEFPKGVINDVNYGGSIKAFAFLMNSRCCVSIDKTREFLSDLTDGTLSISKGMISGLSKEFSGKTESEQNAAFSDLLLSPVMGADCTNARVNGKSAQVYVCATPDKAMYFAREQKGHRGVERTPIEDYQGILVHDHDRTFHNYGSGHQECLAHVLRYLKDSMENEPGLEWSGQMRELIREMIHCRNSSDPDEPPDSGKADEFESRYADILATARKEYEYEPPSRYYKDGYNLYRRMDEFKGSHLLFLREAGVPSDNNRSERLLRVCKRKQKQVMAFRSLNSLDDLCRCMSVLSLLCSQGGSLYTAAAKIFD